MTKLKKPLLTVMLIYFICYLFRFIEYFLIQTDRTFWGEAFLHKMMQFTVVGLNKKTDALVKHWTPCLAFSWRQRFKSKYN